MAKSVDALGLGSNDAIMQVQVLFCVSFFLFFIFSFPFSSMKTHLPKLKRFPLATPQKKAAQQWSSLLKLSVQRQRFFKNQTRFFSIEYGMSLPKRLFWQIAICQTPKGGAFENTGSDVSVFLPKTPSLEHPWNVFRSVFFGKMWILNNPSLVPGVVWPMKSQKGGVAKIRALKALSHLIGKKQKKWLLENFQSFWNLSHQTKPMLWTFASSLDSLKTNVLLKSGWAGTVPAAFHLVTHQKSVWNGFFPEKTFGFTYFGDCVQFFPKNPKNFETFLSEMLTYGLTKQGSLNLMKPFLWFVPFFQNQKKSSFSKNKTSFFFSMKKGKNFGNIQKMEKKKS